MISSTVWARLVLSPVTLHSVSSVAPAVESLGTVAVSGEWSIVLALYCSCTVAIYPHALYTLTALSARMSYRPLMTLMSGALKTCARVLGTCVPSYTCRHASLFFMLEARGPQRVTGHVATPKHTSAGRRDSEP
jgi:hypothetical protein